MQRGGLVMGGQHSHFLLGGQWMPIGCGGGEFQDVFARRLLNVDTGQRVPTAVVAGPGEYDVVLQPSAMQRASRLVELNLEKYRRTTLQAL